MGFETAVVTWMLACQASSMGAFVTVSELSDLLNGSGISARQAAAKAAEVGVHLPYGTAAGYWSGKHPAHPSEVTLEGLAEVTGIPLRRLRRAAGAPAGENTPWQPPDEANQLTQRQRHAIEQLIRSIVRSTDDVEPKVIELLGSKDPRMDRTNHRKKRQ